MKSLTSLSDASGLHTAVHSLIDGHRSRNGKPHHPYPDRMIMAQVTEALLDLLFPEYRLNTARGVNVSDRIARTGDQVFRLLTEQVSIATQHHAALAEGASSSASVPQDAEQVVLSLFEAMAPIRQSIAEDLQAAYLGDPAAHEPDEVAVSYPTYTAVGTYRLAHELYLQGLPFIPRMMTEYAHRSTGIDIHPGATIGRSFFIDHGTGVVIGETAEIRDRVRLYQGVTLGAANFLKDAQGQLIRGRKRHPTVEEDVTVFANATILGGDTVIGARSIIGSNVWLAQSIASDSVVTMGEPNLKIRAKNRSPHSASIKR